MTDPFYTHWRPRVAEHDWRRIAREGPLAPPAYEREGALSLGLASVGLLAMVLLAGLLLP